MLNGMLVSIIIIALLIGLFFLVMAIALGGFIYNGMKQNRDLQKKCMKILIPSVVVWLLLVVINTVLIIVYLYNNGGQIIDLISQILEFIRK